MLYLFLGGNGEPLLLEGVDGHRIGLASESESHVQVVPNYFIAEFQGEADREAVLDWLGEAEVVQTILRVPVDNVSLLQRGRV